MLSSDILEQQFGPTRLRIIEQTTDYRIIQTIAVDSEMVLELSFVTFNNVSAHPAVHTQILNGSSIGKAYKASNVALRRVVSSVRKSPVPDKLKTVFESSQQLTIVEVSILVGPEKSHYCDIVEIYNPSVKWPQAVTTRASSLPKSLEKFLNLF